MSYYWVSLDFKVEGEERDEDYPPVYPDNSVTITGKLFHDGEPVVDTTIEAVGVVTELNKSTKTDNTGYFELHWDRTYDWSRVRLCGSKGRFVAIIGKVGEGIHNPDWMFNCTYACHPTSPTPSPTPSPTKGLSVFNCLFPRAIGGIILPRIKRNNATPRINCLFEWKKYNEME